MDNFDPALISAVIPCPNAAPYVEKGLRACWGKAIRPTCWRFSANTCTATHPSPSGDGCSMPSTCAATSSATLSPWI